MVAGTCHPAKPVQLATLGVAFLGSVNDQSMSSRVTESVSIDTEVQQNVTLLLYLPKNVASYV